MASSLESILDRHHLTQEGISKQITDGHMEVISRSLCGKWRSLPAHLKLNSIVVGDIDRMQLKEDEKRREFFSTWKEKQGSRVTYKRLISALLRIECTHDAESICRLLEAAKDAGSGSQHHQLLEASTALTDERSDSSIAREGGSVLLKRILKDSPHGKSKEGDGESVGASCNPDQHKGTSKDTRHQEGGRSSLMSVVMVVGGITIILLWLGYMYVIYVHAQTGEEPIKDSEKKDTAIHSQHYKDCKEVYLGGKTTNGVYTIKPNISTPAFQVYCDMDTDGGGWTVFQRRMDGSVDFYRKWDDYEKGFGNLTGEYWLGLLHLHSLSVSSPQELRVDLGAHDDKKCFAHYSSFSVAGTNEKYRLQVSGYSGGAGDSLAWHSGMQFTTKDRDNDIHRNVNCAAVHKGGWWYARCHDSNLNGYYYHDGGHRNYADGVNWVDWKGYHYSLQFTEMKIRRQ